MPGILIVAEKDGELEKLATGLSLEGFSSAFVAPSDDVVSEIGEKTPALVLLKIDKPEESERVRELSRLIKDKKSLPVIALIPHEILGHLEPGLPVDDFVIMPCDVRELILRVRRLIHNGGETRETELIKSGDLVIDLAQYDVFLAGKRVELTYREYELLRFLMSNRGRVFTREALMDRVWGYDYYGGDRTVDVHITRLRSKIEDSDHSFIETVRNIGYRFRDGI